MNLQSLISLAFNVIPSPFLSQLNCSRSQLALRTALLPQTRFTGDASIRSHRLGQRSSEHHHHQATNKIVTITTSIRLA